MIDADYSSKKDNFPLDMTKTRCQGNMGTPSFGDPGFPYFLKNRGLGSIFVCNSYIPSAREVSDLKVKGGRYRPRPLNQILSKHEVYNYFVSHP